MVETNVAGRINLISQTLRSLKKTQWCTFVGRVRGKERECTVQITGDSIINVTELTPDERERTLNLIEPHIIKGFKSFFSRGRGPKIRMERDEKGTYYVTGELEEDLNTNTELIENIFRKVFDLPENYELTLAEIKE